MTKKSIRTMLVVAVGVMAVFGTTQAHAASLIEYALFTRFTSGQAAACLVQANQCQAARDQAAEATEFALGLFPDLSECIGNGECEVGDKHYRYVELSFEIAQDLNTVADKTCERAELVCNF